MAVAITRKLLEANTPDLAGAIRVEGRAALSEIGKRKVSYGARKAIIDLYGEDLLKGYVPKVLDETIAREASLVLAMDKASLGRSELPEDKTYLVTEFFGSSGDITNPFPDGKSDVVLQRYLDVALELKDLLEDGLDKLIQALDA
jgi:hypothetical protein